MWSGLPSWPVYVVSPYGLTTYSAISNSIRHQHFKWFKDLPQSDREHFTKAIAVFEDTVGGIGSPTVLQNLLAGK